MTTETMTSEAPAPSAREAMVQTRDGVHLATDVCLPDGDGPFPAVFVRTPYDKSSRYTPSGTKRSTSAAAGTRMPPRTSAASSGSPAGPPWHRVTLRCARLSPRSPASAWGRVTSDRDGRSTTRRTSHLKTSCRSGRTNGHLVDVD
ncbi:CocE/NonD family hydrolase [Streptomyces acidiscabies]|uniref:CocE/NonD family hydrolase n=1 Tax=Streptomyces acidiscabies TaxID=42234 RepID=UPI002D21BB7A|nr:CocE/NonD family hydrolase [Streptomyces acidiscabies]